MWQIRQTRRNQKGGESVCSQHLHVQHWSFAPVTVFSHLLVTLWLCRLLLLFLFLIILLLLFLFVWQDVVQPGQVMLWEHQIQQLPHTHQTQNLHPAERWAITLCQRSLQPLLILRKQAWNCPVSLFVILSSYILSQKFTFIDLSPDNFDKSLSYLETHTKKKAKWPWGI